MATLLDAPGDAAAPPAVGRPRDAALDANSLRAAMELLGEGGLVAVTMHAVAQRVGAGKASLYRRWKSRDELLAEALMLYSGSDVAIDTGNLRDDLVLFYGNSYGIGNHVMQAAMQEILGNVRQHLDWLEQFAPGRLTQRRAAARALFDRAVARGEIAPPAELALVMDLVPALLLHGFNTRGQKVSRASITRCVDGVLMPLLRAGGGHGR